MNLIMHEVVIVDNICTEETLLKLSLILVLLNIHMTLMTVMCMEVSEYSLLEGGY